MGCNARRKKLECRKFYFKICMNTETQDGAREIIPAQLLAAASLGKSSALCYCLINNVKIESNTTSIKYLLK